MKRRQFLKISGIAAAAPLLNSSALGGNSRKRPPNLIVIMADDLGAKELACYGNKQHDTPNLDRLAKTGVQFNTCYSTPICHPTRFEIMTGQYGHHNGVFQFPGRPGGPAVGSPEDDISSKVTFAHVLKRRGYATAHSGKWQLTGKIPTLINECGFDEYCMWAYKHNLPEGVKHTGGWEGKAGRKTSRYWHPSIVKNKKYLPTKPDDYGPDIFTDFIVDFIKRKKDKPFFVYFPMCLTHGPYYSTPDTTTSEADKFKNLKTNFKCNVEYMDKLVGRIVKALDAEGLTKNTVVFFTGDNGTGGQGKGQNTELGARVPMIVNCPGTVKTIGLSDQLVDLSDIMPTLADFADAKLPKDRPIDGQTFAPILRGKKRHRTPVDIQLSRRPPDSTHKTMAARRQRPEPSRQILRLRYQPRWNRLQGRHGFKRPGCACCEETIWRNPCRQAASDSEEPCKETMTNSRFYCFGSF